MEPTYQHGQRLTVKLDALDLNELNPRTITDASFALLTQSLIDFPEMLAVRGVVAKPTSPGRFLALGGNMRTQAKTWLVQQTDEEKHRLTERALESKYPTVDGDADPLAWSIEAREAYRAKLDQLFHDDRLELTLAVGLSEAQEFEFVIKDNTDFGKFNFDALANVAGEVPYAEWGVEGIPGPVAEPRVSLAADDDNEGESGDSSSESTAKVLIIAFDNADDVQTAESVILEALETEGYNGFTIKAIVRTNE